MQYPPTNKPTLEVNASTNYQSEEITMTLPSHKKAKSFVDSDPWDNDFGESVEKQPEQHSPLDLQAMEAEDKVFRVFWKGDPDENKE